MKEFCKMFENLILKFNIEMFLIEHYYFCDSKNALALHVFYDVLTILLLMYL